MQKRSFLTVICVLLITSAFAHELDDISLTDETEPAPPKAPSDKSPDDDTPGPDPSLGMTFEDYMGSYEGKLALDRAYEEALEKYEYYDQVPEEMSQPYIEPIEVNKIEQLYDLFKPGVLPNILVIYEDKATTEGTVSVMINNLKYYNGLADIYLL
jgi:hypothetical protein